MSSKDLAETSMNEEATCSQTLYTNLHGLVNSGSILLHLDVLEKILPHIHGKAELLNLRLTCRALKSAVDKLPQLELALSTTWVELNEDNLQQFLDEVADLPFTAFRLKCAKNMKYLASNRCKRFLDKYTMQIKNLDVNVTLWTIVVLSAISFETRRHFWDQQVSQMA